MNISTLTNPKVYMVDDYKLTSAVSTLLGGGLILFPTDTIWGIGCDASNPESVEKVCRLKDQKQNKGFIVLVDSIDMLRKYVYRVHPRIETLLTYHVRPLTVVYEGSKNLPSNLTAEDGSVAVRISLDPFCKMLIKKFGKPIVATSANLNDMPSPSNFGAISSEIIKGVDYVVQHRQDEPKNIQDSVIVKLSEKEELIFLRK